MALLGLALLDSTSVGTLVIPLVLVLRARRVNVVSLAVYFLTVCGIYLGLGVALLLGIDLLNGVMDQIAASPVTPWLQLVLGVALFAVGVGAPNPRKKGRTELLQGNRSVEKTGGRRLLGMVGLGAVASLTEAATMVPYLAANGIIAGLDVAWSGRLAILALYCVVMILPALVLLGAVLLWGAKIFPWVERVLPRLEYEAKVTLLWVAAIVGFIMAQRAAVALGLIEWLAGLTK